jgi:hypothetical protein
MAPRTKPGGPLTILPYSARLGLKQGKRVSHQPLAQSQTAYDSAALTFSARQWYRGLQAVVDKALAHVRQSVWRRPGRRLQRVRFSLTDLRMPKVGAR